jgi:multiple sugar transport system substrate-binding protein
VLSSSTFVHEIFSQKKAVTLKATVSEPAFRWVLLFGSAVEKLRANHPESDIRVNFTVLPYGELQHSLLYYGRNITDQDLVSIDQPWLGALAKRGVLENLTKYTQAWNRSTDWNQNHWEGGKYLKDVYGIWAWTDVRGMWYWKDLLNSSRVEPEDLATWDGYLSSAEKLQSHLPNGTQAMHLVGAAHSPDAWYPYLWMLGGDILIEKEGHPTKGTYWFPAYNSSRGIEAMKFIDDQVQSGIKPQREHHWGKEFADRKFAVMLEGSWLLGGFRGNITDIDSFQQKIGLIPKFPIPGNINQSATLMGGWLLGIPSTSSNKDLAWELIAAMVDPDILLPMLKQTGYLPTQKSMMTGGYLKSMEESIPYFDDLASMISIGHVRPNIPEYGLISDHIRVALNEVYDGSKEPKEALDDAANKSAKQLGWK